MALECQEQHEEENKPTPCETQLDVARKVYEEDEDEEKGICYDCVDPQQLACGFASRPNYNNIALVDSTNCHFGNKTYYQGPVTVLKQIVVPPAVDYKSTAPPQPDVVKDDSPREKDANERCIEKDLCRGPTKRRVIASGITAVTAGLIVASIYLVVATTRLSNKEKAPPGGGTLDDTGDGTLTSVYPYPNGTTETLDVDSLRIWDRSYWLAQPPVDVVDNLTTPVQYVIITHSATENCFTTADCVGRVRYIQMFHIETNGWSDIGYNYLVGGEGAVYEGRGWDKVGAHTLGWNVKSIGICVIGTFTTMEPTRKQLIATQKLIARGVALGKIAKDYELLAHNQVKSFQRFHLYTKKWSDISYNFLVGGDGFVYEGRGWNKVGSHTLGWDRKSIGICVIGTFTTMVPAPKQLAETQRLIKVGVALGKIERNYKLIAHCQGMSTESPGRRFVKILQKWPHWYNGTTRNCTVRSFQRYHKETKKLNDISYNFLVGGDGSVYEGRGWNTVGAHTIGWNRNSIGICVIGAFTSVAPPTKQLAETQRLIELGVSLGKIDRNYKLLAHCQASNTESPGRKFVQILKKWPHWYSGTTRSCAV